MMARNYFNPEGSGSDAAKARLRLSEILYWGIRHKGSSLEMAKYIVLEEKTIDKLELVMQALNARGVKATGAVILSGFRAPYYKRVV